MVDKIPPDLIKRWQNAIERDQITDEDFRIRFGYPKARAIDSAARRGVIITNPNTAGFIRGVAPPVPAGLAIYNQRSRAQRIGVTVAELERREAAGERRCPGRKGTKNFPAKGAHWVKDELGVRNRTRCVDCRPQGTRLR